MGDTTTSWSDALIGVALAFFATIFSTIANVVIKYTTMQNERRPVHQQRHVCKQPLWWVVFGMYLANGGLDFAAYAFASISVVAPISALTIVINVIAAYFILGERITRREAFGSFVLTAGAALAVFSGSREEPEEDVEGIKRLFRATPFIIFTLCKVAVILFGGYIVFLSSHARKLRRQHQEYLAEVRDWSVLKQKKQQETADAAAIAAIPLPRPPPDLTASDNNNNNINENKRTSVEMATNTGGGGVASSLPSASSGIVNNSTSSLPPPTAAATTAGLTVLAALKSSNTDPVSTATTITNATSSISSSITAAATTSTTPTGSGGSEATVTMEALWSPRGKKPPPPFACPPSPPLPPPPSSSGTMDMVLTTTSDEMSGENGNGLGWKIQVDSDPLDDPLESKELAIHLDSSLSSSSPPPSPTQRLTLARSNSEDRGKPLPIIPPSPLLASMMRVSHVSLPLSSSSISEPLRSNSELDWVASMPSVHLHVHTGNDPAKPPKPYLLGLTIPPPSPLLYPTNSHLNQLQRTHVVRFHVESLPDGTQLIDSTVLSSDSVHVSTDEPSPRAVVAPHPSRQQRTYSASGRPLPFPVKKNIKYAIRMVAYALLQSSWGSWTNMFAKAAVMLISGSTGGNDQTSNYLFWLCVVATVVCAVLQLKLLSGMLNAFDAVSVIPVYQTLFIFNLILTGGIFFQEFTADYLASYNIYVFVAAILLVIIGILIMTTVHKDGPNDDEPEPVVTALPNAVLHPVAKTPIAAHPPDSNKPLTPLAV